MQRFLLFPVHLFKDIAILKDKHVYLIEEERYFSDFYYHKLKIAYHRATMMSYVSYLKQHDINVTYISDTTKFYSSLSKHTCSTYTVGDNVLKQKLLKQIPSLMFIDSPNFLINEQLIKDNLHLFYSNDNFIFMNFYKWQRRRLNILVTSSGNPVGNQWSYDHENRVKLPSTVKPPNISYQKTNKYIEEAINYTNKHYSSNYGSLDHFIYPINHDGAKQWLKQFLRQRLANFGTYEDAVDTRYPFVFHSVLSPMMNIGLLTDTEVLDETIKYYNKHSRTIKINSLEGFIRQIIGWRNYVYMIYLVKGSSIKHMNFMNHNNKLTKSLYRSLWEGTTSIKPVDDIITTSITPYAYAHHIERLMYLGNYLLLIQLRPIDVYRMFMEWTIDAYEWVMIPNVFGMSQHADGGVMMTRPYFASSNYILRMSNYKKDDWCRILDCLYYNFVNKHKKYLKKNYSTSIQVKFWNDKSNTEKLDIIRTATTYMNKFFS